MLQSTREIYQEILLKLLSNPEMAALLKSLAKGFSQAVKRNIARFPIILDFNLL